MPDIRERVVIYGSGRDGNDPLHDHIDGDFFGEKLGGSSNLHKPEKIIRSGIRSVEMPPVAIDLSRGNPISPQEVPPQRQE